MFFNLKGEASQKKKEKSIRTNKTRIERNIVHEYGSDHVLNEAHKAAKLKGRPGLTNSIKCY
jgi:hypothetical protein